MNRTYVYNGAIKKKVDTYYKIVTFDWTCLGFEYRVGETYSIPEDKLKLCSSGFHCCAHPVQCLEYYNLSPRNHYVEVKMLGKIVESLPVDSPKYATNIMKIEREIPYEEWLELCTVTESRFTISSQSLYMEQDYIKGRLMERRDFNMTGTRRRTVTYQENGSCLKIIKYFSDGTPEVITTQTAPDFTSTDTICYSTKGNVKWTEKWRLVAGKESERECVETCYRTDGSIISQRIIFPYKKYRHY
jgi:hypothetical protein